MQSSLNSLKAKVRQFVQKMQSKNIQPSLCLVTFKDHTEKKCEAMVQDNPATPKNENLDRFLDELSKIKISQGGDKEDNQLRALIDATQSPWRAGAARMMVLMTDGIFHFQPSNKGDAGNDTPFYGDVMTSLQNAQVALFAIAPDRDGYSTTFQGNPSLVAVTRGRFFDFGQMAAGNFSMDSIFQAISERVSTRYNAKYIVEENENLDSTLDLARRNARVRLPSFSQYVIHLVAFTSTQPHGHPEYRKRFLLSKPPRILNKNFSVRVDKMNWSGSVRIEGQELVFETAPRAGAFIEVTYDSSSLRDGLVLRPMILPQSLDVNGMVVNFNGTEVPIEQLRLSRDLEGRLILDPAYTVYSTEDPYHIIDRSGLSIVVEGRVESSGSP